MVNIFLLLYIYLLILYIDQETRWNSTYEMLRRFLYVYEAIKLALSASKIKNKNNLSFSDDEIFYFKELLDIFTIFVKATVILQGEKYPTIQYIYPYIFNIRKRLRQKRDNLNLVSFVFFNILKYFILINI